MTPDDRRVGSDGYNSGSQNQGTNRREGNCFVGSLIRPHFSISNVISRNDISHGEYSTISFKNIHFLLCLNFLFPKSSFLIVIVLSHAKVSASENNCLRK